MKYALIIIFTLSGIFGLPFYSYGVNEFTVTVPAGSSVTMGDSQATLSFTVTNVNPSPAGRAIKTVFFNIDTTKYNFSAATLAPTACASAWSVQSPPACQFPGCISFTSGGGIAGGASCTFDIILTGPNGGLIPSAPQDQTDTLTSVIASKDQGSSQQTGDFTLQGGLPTWTRKSLALTVAARTLSVGVGDNITLTLYVTNRSSATQNGITANPDPPSRTYTGGASVSYVSGPTFNPNPLDLAPGEQGTIVYKFRADATGTVYFTTSVQNSSGAATSGSENSNPIVIANFAAVVTVSPLNVVSGQTVLVKMTVSNNGTTTLNNVTPSLTPQGTATKTLVTPPSPSTVASLAPGDDWVFEWVYTITGTVDQTYLFSGYATSDTLATNTYVSETGRLTQYAVVVSPSTVATGTTANTTFTWTVYNRGGATVKGISITIPAPLTSNCAASKGWGYVSNTPPPNWTSTTGGAPVGSVTFASNTPVDTYGIPVGGSKDFRITFNCVPQVTADTDYNFPVLITDKNNNQATVNTVITVTAYLLTLTPYNEDCISAAPASKPADGDARYCLKATLTTGGSPVSGRTIYFSLTGGSGFLYGTSADTDAGGVAQVYLTSPCSTSDVTTTVKAEYNPDTFDTENFLFTGITGANLSYVNGSLSFNGASPVLVNTNDTGSFSLQMRNCGTTPITISTTNSALAIRRNTPDTFSLSSPVTINAGATATLDFVSGTIRSGTLKCSPVLTANAGAGYTGTYSYNKSPRGDQIPIDTVTVNGGSICPASKISPKVLDWREVLQ